MKQPLINREERRRGNVALYLLGVVLFVAGFAGGRVLYRNGVSEVAVAVNYSGNPGNPMIDGTARRDHQTSADKRAETRDPMKDPQLFKPLFHSKRPDEWCTQWCEDNTRIPAPTGNSRQCKDDDIPDHDDVKKMGFYQCNMENCSCVHAKKVWEAGEGPRANEAVPVKPVPAEDEAEPEPPREEIPPTDPDDALDKIIPLNCPTYQQAMAGYKRGSEMIVVNGMGYYLCAFNYQTAMIGQIFKTINNMFAKDTGGYNRKVLKINAVQGRELPRYERWDQVRDRETNAEDWTIYEGIDGISTPHNVINTNGYPYHLTEHQIAEGEQRTNLLFKVVFDKPYEAQPRETDQRASCRSFCEKSFGTKLEAPYARRDRESVMCKELKVGQNEDKSVKGNTQSGCTEAKCC